MKKTVACVLSACALLAGGAAMQRASAQERTQTPGQSTRANVWIQNRGNGEAVPVSIEKVGAESLWTTTLGVVAGSFGLMLRLTSPI